MIGRQEEAAALWACVESVLEGRGAVALVTGESGSGKTRLIDDLRARMRNGRIVSAVAAAYDYAEAPYAPVRDVLVTLDQRLPKVLARDEALRAALEPVRSLGDGCAPATDPQAARRRTLDAVVTAIGKYASAAPLVLIVEDLHWLDQASADVLLHVAAHVEAQRVALVLTYRTDDDRETEAGRDAVARLMRRSRGGRIALRSLTTLDAMTLIDSATKNRTLDPSLRRTICELGDGNPLLILELVAHTVEARRTLDGAVPLSLRDITHQRIETFDSGELALLRVAALLGEFDAVMLARIAERAPEDVGAVLRKARDRRVIAESPSSRTSYVFRHALIRRSIGEELLAGERAVMHARIARYLEDNGVAAATVAHHVERAGETKAARRLYERAGDEASAVHAYADAAAAYARAIGAGTVDDEAVAIGWKFLDASDLSVRRVERMPLLEALRAYAVRTERALDAARLSVEIARWSFSLVDDVGAAEAAREAFAVADASAHLDVRFEAAALCAWLLVHMKQLDEAKLWIERCEPLLAHGSPRSVAWYHEARAAYDVHSGTLLTWREECEKMVTAAESLHPEALTRRLTSAASLALASNVEDFAFARDCHARAQRIAKECGIPQNGAVLAGAAYISYTLGDLIGARNVLAQAMAVAEDDPNATVSIARTGIPLALRLRDETLMRRCANENVLDFAYQASSPQVFGPVAAGFSEKLAADGRNREAVLLIERTIARLPSAANNLAIVMQVARLKVSGVRARAEALLDELAPTSVSGRAARALFGAYFAAGNARTTLARNAAADFRGVGWPLWEAEALELAGDVAAARALYARCDSTADLVRLDGGDSARASGVLSPREWDVARLIAEGKSNRAIGDALSLSERTVENHVASIFTKCALRSRAEIAVLVARERQLPLAK